jgi:cell division protein FtsW (lipid II flippase)
VILLYIVLLHRGFRIAMLADDGFSKLLAAGLTATLALQAFIIVAGVTGLIPLTGITLPFVSYGGSSLVANFLVVWLLLAVSNRVNARAAGLR